MIVVMAKPFSDVHFLAPTPERHRDSVDFTAGKHPHGCIQYQTRSSCLQICLVQHE